MEEREVVGGSIGLHRKSVIGFSGFQRQGLRSKDGEEDLGKGKGSNFGAVVPFSYKEEENDWQDEEKCFYAGRFLAEDIAGRLRKTICPII